MTQNIRVRTSELLERALAAKGLSEVPEVFKSQPRGDLIEPADARYENEFQVFNPMTSREPRLIATWEAMTARRILPHFERVGS